MRAIPGVIIASVLKDGLYFTTGGQNGLKRLSERLMEVEERYADKQRGVVAQALDIARSYLPVLETAAATVAELDAFASLAHLATSAPGSYVRPTLRPPGEGDIDLKQARHPVMEFQDDVTFIANDYYMHREEGRFHIITGE